MEGIESMSKLTTLHLRDNQIEALEGFPDSLDALQYLNLRYMCMHVLYVHVYV